MTYRRHGTPPDHRSDHANPPGCLTRLRPARPVRARLMHPPKSLEISPNNSPETDRIQTGKPPKQTGQTPEGPKLHSARFEGGKSGKDTLSKPPNKAVRTD